MRWLRVLMCSNFISNGVSYNCSLLHTFLNGIISNLSLTNHFNVTRPNLSEPTRNLK